MQIKWWYHHHQLFFTYALLAKILIQALQLYIIVKFPLSVSQKYKHYHSQREAHL
jgi:hypothetical protein